MSARLMSRVEKLESRQQMRKGLRPYSVQSEGGTVSATVRPLAGGRPAAVTIWDDALNVDADTALERIRPRLPSVCSFYLFPRDLTLNEWARTYGSDRRTL